MCKGIRYERIGYDVLGVAHFHFGPSFLCALLDVISIKFGEQPRTYNQKTVSADENRTIALHFLPAH